MNQVELQGRILSISANRRATTVTLFVDEGRTDKNGTRIVNFPNILFFEKERALLFDFAPGDFVNIRATVKRNGITPNEGASSFYPPHIRGTEVSHVKNEISEIFGEDLNGRYEYKNRFYAKGVISSKRFKNGVGTVNVRCEGDRFSVPLTVFMDEKSFSSRYEINSEIAAICEIRTSRKRYDTDRGRFNRDFMNFVILSSSTKRSDNAEEPVITSVDNETLDNIKESLNDPSSDNSNVEENNDLFTD